MRPDTLGIGTTRAGFLRGVIAATLGFFARTILNASPKTALRVLQTATRLDGRNRHLLYDLYTAHWRLREWDLALRALEQAADLVPAEVPYRRALAGACLQCGRYDWAARQFELCLADWPRGENSSARVNVMALYGICLCMKGAVEQGEGLLEAASGICDWDLDLLAGRVFLYRVTGRSQRVEELLESYEKAYPGLYVVPYLMGHHAQYYLHDRSGSTVWYERSLEDWSNETGRRFCSQFRCADGQPEDLIEEYIEALVSSGQANTAWTFIHSSAIAASRRTIATYEIQFSLLTEDFPAAERRAEDWLARNDSENPEVLAMLARAEAEQGRHAEARGNVMRGLSTDPESVEAVETLAEMQLDKREYEAARDRLRSLLHRNPYAPGWTQSLARCYVGVNDFSAARDTYKRLTQLDPHDANHWVDLALAHQRLGEYQSAHSAAARAVAFGTLTESARANISRILEIGDVSL